MSLFLQLLNHLSLPSLSKLLELFLLLKMQQSGNLIHLFHMNIILAIWKEFIEIVSQKYRCRWNKSYQYEVRPVAVQAISNGILVEIVGQKMAHMEEN